MSKAKSANDSINHKDKCLVTLQVIFDTGTTDSSVAKVALKILQERSITCTPN
jgi:hypothetical protein